jgi:hypothetical protein
MLELIKHFFAIIIVLDKNREDMKAMWIVGMVGTLFLAACNANNNASQGYRSYPYPDEGDAKNKNQYVDGYLPGNAPQHTGIYYNKYHPSGNFGYPGYEGPNTYYVVPKTDQASGRDAETTETYREDGSRNLPKNKYVDREDI